MVGRNTNVVMGKKSGKSSVEFKLAEKNISMTAEQIETMVAQVKEMGIEKKRCLTEDEFDSIASALLQK
jgi:methanogen homocitrate synthase